MIPLSQRGRKEQPVATEAASRHARRMVALPSRLGSEQQGWWGRDGLVAGNGESEHL